jgi:hypothetical protein
MVLLYASSYRTVAGSLTEGLRCSPDPRHTIRVEHRVERHERELLLACLGDEHPVERIAVLASVWVAGACWRISLS